MKHRVQGGDGGRSRGCGGSGDGGGNMWGVGDVGDRGGDGKKGANN